MASMTREQIFEKQEEVYKREIHSLQGSLDRTDNYANQALRVSKVS